MIRKVLLLLVMLNSTGIKAGQLQPIELLDQDTHASYAALSPEPIEPVEFAVELPDIDLVDHRNQSVALQSIFANDKQVIFAFFFTHCVSVCTTITLSLKSLQQDLPPNTLIAMISIDPETDTPEVLGSYAKQHRIDDSNWYLLTGEISEVIALQKDFEAYRGNKMNHTTSLFVKKSDSGFVTEFKRNFGDIPFFLAQR